SIAGTLIDGTSIDLTSRARGTNYASSDLLTCNFGVEDGRIFAAGAGSCTGTGSNSGFQTTIPLGGAPFAPVALGGVFIPGTANNVDVAGNYAYVAAGANGLQVVDVSDRTQPTIVAAASTPGDARDVKVVGSLAYVAAGPAGLQVVDVSIP